jgi:hypothetical protein
MILNPPPPFVCCDSLHIKNVALWDHQDLAAIVDGQQEQLDKLEEHNEEAKANTKAGLEQVQYTMWKMCGQQQQEQQQEADQGRDRGIEGCAPHHPRWKACRGAFSDIIPSNSSTEHPYGCNFSHEDGKNDDSQLASDHSQQGGGSITEDSEDPQQRSNRTAGDVLASMKWRIPPPLASLKADVRESAHSAYKLGHALVEDLVEQVHSAARSNPHARRLTCSPASEDFGFEDHPGARDLHDHDGDDIFYEPGDEMKV